MSTAANQYPNLHEIVELIESVRDRRWRLNLIRALLAFVGVSLVAFIPVVIVLGFWPAHPPQWARIAAGVEHHGVLCLVVRALMCDKLRPTARSSKHLPAKSVLSTAKRRKAVDGTSPAMIRRAIGKPPMRQKAGREDDCKVQNSRTGVVMGVTVAVLGVFHCCGQRLSGYGGQG